MTFPDPDLENVSWPVDFCADEKATMRNWMEQTMAVAADELITEENV